MENQKTPCFQLKLKQGKLLVIYLLLTQLKENAQ